MSSNTLMLILIAKGSIYVSEIKWLGRLNFPGAIAPFSCLPSEPQEVFLYFNNRQNLSTSFTKAL